MNFSTDLYVVFCRSTVVRSSLDKRMLSHDFPGNIRELENIIEHRFVLCHGQLIERSDLPDSVRRPEHRGAEDLQEIKTLRQMEMMMIEQSLRRHDGNRAALRRHDGNRAAAARELGINPSTLFRKLKTLQIDV